nr:MAG: ORF1 [Torque teno midi virus]
MPFWWKRRKRPWFGRWRYRRRFQTKYRRRRKRRIPRRRNRRTYRRRRKHKVRRKRKKIPIQQWQPESIKKCKIRGYSTLVLGAEGNQYLCWTNEESSYPQPKAPGGGGFGNECITLEWLYDQYLAHNCIWTTSNQYTDLCRYTGCKIIFFRHPETDFIVAYNIQGPWDLHKLSYTEQQPQNMLLHRKHRVILSQKKAPHRKPWVTIKIKPPKNMSTRWFFQREFADAILVQLLGSAASFSYPKISPIAQSQLLTLYYLNTDFYPNPDWGQTRDHPWKPHRTATTFTFKTPSKTVKIDSKTFPDTTDGYYKSINRNTGWWQPTILQCRDLLVDGKPNASYPVFTARYNPNEDKGPGNEVYLVSILQSSWKPPQVNPDFVIRGQPLWMAFYGFYSFLKKQTHDKLFYDHYIFVVKCPAIKPTLQTSQQTIFPLIDPAFWQGKLPFDEQITQQIETFWYPKASFQTQTINSLVESGPFMPRYTNILNSTWELTYKYCFYFKWGGPQVFNPAIDDPEHQGFYPTPGNMQSTIQITNPIKQVPETMFHEWDYRRGVITQTAIKRMQENLQTDTDFESDETGSPKKKRKISKELPQKKQKEEEIYQCLQTLCKKDTYQDPQTIQQLIEQQQQHQSTLKLNILKLLTELKKQQQFLNLQTGAYN